jgi:hypothetical protein
VAATICQNRSSIKTPCERPLSLKAHICKPFVVARRPAGRIVMAEPAITWASSLFYRMLPVVTSADPLVVGSSDPKRGPFPTLIATRDRERFRQMFPQVRIERFHWLSLVVYPLTGGFRPWSLISGAVARRVLRIERALEPLVGRAVTFRMMIVVEKAAAH